MKFSFLIISMHTLLPMRPQRVIIKGVVFKKSTTEKIRKNTLELFPHNGRNKLKCLACTKRNKGEPFLLLPTKKSVENHLKETSHLCAKITYYQTKT